MSLEEALPPQDDVIGDALLDEAALAVEKYEALAAEMAEWEAATIGDGLCADGCVPTQPPADHK
jgi:hypothetical protein